MFLGGSDVHNRRVMGDRNVLLRWSLVVARLGDVSLPELALFSCLDIGNMVVIVDVQLLGHPGVSVQHHSGLPNRQGPKHFGSCPHGRHWDADFPQSFLPPGLIQQFDVLAGSLLDFEEGVALERLDHLEDSLSVLAELVVQLEQGRKTVLDGLIGSCGSENDLLN